MSRGAAGDETAPTRELSCAKTKPDGTHHTSSSVHTNTHTHIRTFSPSNLPWLRRRSRRDGLLVVGWTARPRAVPAAVSHTAPPVPSHSPRARCAWCGGDGLGDSSANAMGERGETKANRVRSETPGCADRHGVRSGVDDRDREAAQSPRLARRHATPLPTASATTSNQPSRTVRSPMHVACSMHMERSHRSSSC